MAAAVAAVAACSLDSELPAPLVASASEPSECGTTETLIPKLLSFAREERLAPLEGVIERHLLPTAEDPAPDPSLRTLLGAAVRIVTTLGIGETAKAAEVAAQSESLRELEPLILAALRFISGDLDGRDRYEAGDAAAHFIRACDAEHLLTSIEGLMTLRSRAHGGRLWLAVLLEQGTVLIDDPFFQPFLETFERESERGRPAVVALLAQIFGFLGDEGFHISRVETLLESAVYPLVNDDLRRKIEDLVDLLAIATSPEAGVLEPLQRAVRCGNQSRVQRDVLFTFVYDLVVSEQVGLRSVLGSLEGLITEEDSERLLEQLASVVRVVREEHGSREDLLELAAILLSRPEVAHVLPVLIELIEEGVVIELLDAVAALLEGCGRT